MLNDHEIGGPRSKDPKIVGDLRKARDIFRQWDPEVSFCGYWENSGLVKSGNTNLPVSLYRRPDSLLVIVGNTGKEAADVNVVLNWGSLKLDPGKLTLTDAETGKAIPVGKPQDGFKIKVNRHDLRLVLIAPPGKFAMK